MFRRFISTQDTVSNSGSSGSSEPINITWAELVALQTRKTGDRFRISDRKDNSYPLPMGTIILSSSNTFNYELPNGLEEKIKI